MRGGLFAFVGFPSLIDHVRVDGVCVRERQMGIRECKFWRIGEAGHALIPMGATHDDLIPVFMDLRGSIAKIGDGTVLHPRATAVDAWAMTAFTVKRDAKFSALANRVPAHFRVTP